MESQMMEMVSRFVREHVHSGDTMERDGQQLAESSTEYVLSKKFDGVRLLLSCIMQVNPRLWRVCRSTRSFQSKARL